MSGTGKVELKLMMHGMWEAPLGLTYLAFGNVEAGIGVQPGVPIPSIEFTGQLNLGKVGSGAEIKSKIAVGYDPVNPMNIYFYSELSSFSIGALCKAFGFNTNFPKPVAETGFPEGVLIGFTPNPKGEV